MSYIWPQTKRIYSDFNGELEVKTVNGRKLLNSKSANYSYGALQQVLEIGLSKIDLTNVNSILLLGLGGGSVIASLRRKFKYKGKIVAVEIDPKMIDIADKEFSISNSDDLLIVNADALEFVQDCISQFDLIIVDLFVDNIVPKQFYTEAFCTDLSRITSEEGSIIFNLGIGLFDRAERESVVNYFYYTAGHKILEFDNILESNALLIVHKTTADMGLAKPSIPTH